MTMRTLGTPDRDGWVIATRRHPPLSCGLCSRTAWHLWWHQPTDTLACGACRWPAG